MQFTPFLNKLKHLLFPSSCVFCGDGLVGDRIVCDSCRASFLAERDVLCPVCGKKAPRCTCPLKHLKDQVFPNVTAAVGRFYNPDHSSDSARLTRLLILKCKKFDLDGVPELLAEDLAILLIGLLYRNGEDVRNWIVTSAPRNPDNLLKYGFDHGEEIAKALAKRLGCTYESTLFRYSGKMQKELDSDERQSNAESGLAARKKSIIHGAKYILVDDVLTTGATMAAASKLLYKNGAGMVLPTAVAKTMHLK